MSYQVKFTETTNPAKPAITVEDLTLNTQTDLSFVGKNYSGWSPVIAENFLHLLENFAKNSPPSTPVEGQLWYDNSLNVNLLKVYDGTTWIPTGSVKKSDSAPLVSNSLNGDLWIDTDNRQLYIFTGSTWILIGPQYSSGLKTGPDVETISDIYDISHPVVVLNSNNERIAIISDTEFTPKLSIPGFSSIKRGYNLTTISSTDGTTTYAPKFWGTASNADSLIINGQTVASSNFIRSDSIVPLNVPLNVRATSGISLGTDLSFNVSQGETSTIFYSRTAGKNIEFILNNDLGVSTVVFVDANAKVGIGNNNTSPQEALDVLGSIAASENFILSGTQDSTGLGVGSITTQGGLSVALKSNFGDNVSIYGTLSLNNLNSNDEPEAGSVLVPGYSTDYPNQTLYDIGSETQKFRNIYADSFVGNITGTVTGTVVGSVDGPATRLLNSTVISLIGDVTSIPVPFNGATQNGTLKFETSISQDLITSKPLTTTSQLDDQFLIYRQSGIDNGVKKISKQTIISSIPTVPVSAIFPFAGRTVPEGYLLCDGSEVLISDYPLLYEAIGFSYRSNLLLVGVGTFALPDLRGRFPLGRDNMDNDLSVETSDGSIVNAGGNRNGSGPSSSPANRTSDVNADILGAGSGLEYRSLSVANIPDHSHNLANEQAEYYVGSLPGAPSDPNATAAAGFSAGATGQGLTKTGGVKSPIIGQEFSVMNPYQTINYIIYTGAIL